MALSGCASTHGIAPNDKATTLSSIDAGLVIRSAKLDANWPVDDWWKAFNDPQLDALVQTALTSSPTLAAARARVRDAEAMSGEAKAYTLPHINGDLTLQRQTWPTDDFYGPAPLASAQTWNNSATLGLLYHLDIWGKDKNVTRRATDLAHATVAKERAARLELETNVVRKYVHLSMLYSLRDIDVQLLARQRKIVDLTQRRYLGGLGTLLDVTQARTSLPALNKAIEAHNEAIQLDKDELAALEGKGPGAGDSIQRPKLVPVCAAGLPSTLPLELVGHRPDVVAARWAVAARARSIDVAHANFYPDINLLATVGGISSIGPLFQFLHAQNGDNSFGPAVSLPIFEGGKLRSELGAASAQYDETVELYNNTILNSLKEIAEQITILGSLKIQQGDAQSISDLNEKNCQLAQKLFRRGLTDYFDVLVTQTKLLHSREEVIRLQSKQLVAFTSLNEALGGGLELISDSPSAAEMSSDSGHVSALPAIPPDARLTVRSD